MSDVINVPFFYKGLGHIRKDTLDNPLMDNYRVLLQHFTGPSLDLFAHRTVRTTVSNQFEPALDVPHARPAEYQQHVQVLHEPVQLGRKGVLQTLNDECFAVVLIDPPYTPLQQKSLYGNMKTLAADLSVDSHRGIEDLYRLSWNYAVKHASSAIVVYGYKLGRASAQWRRSAAWAIGGGSHPAIVAHLFLHASVTVEQEKALLLALEHQARQKKAEVSTLTVLEHTRYEPRAYHVGDKVTGCDVYLFSKADEFKRERKARDPQAHPSYLSQAMLALSQATVVPRIHTVLGALYQVCRSHKKPVACFSPGVQRSLYAAHTWSDARFILEK